ncbi:serine--tRNA ligase [Paenibacillus mendelii]|uniref:Serine--tRNA ligase n=1 Tax=Paenibacillus mendelii TaxID=206163 RepID=A0ABV6J781_9BACL|nr:serine--tRNA ligase [Paenibacillus mendelii]MCQ6562093.1 serine--tRNA ligase [Paenibacillus mendelii]
MLDIRMIRIRAQEVQEAARRKGLNFDVTHLLKADERRRELLMQVETLRAKRNKRSDIITQMLRKGRTEDAEKEKLAASEGMAHLKQVEAELRAVDGEFETLMFDVPNFISPDTPIGLSDRDNVEVRRYGEVAAFPFEAKSHVELGDSLGIVDLQRGVKIGGSRHYVLRNNGLLLHRAVQQLALDLLAAKGYDLLDVPILVKEETLHATGFFPSNRDQTFAVNGGERWLAGTAEVPLVSLYSGEIVDVTEPLLLGAVSPCFRSEVGSAGRDVHGLYRVHQFSKVEQVVICRADEELSEQLLQNMVKHSEELLQLLELPYRVVAVCSGDMSQKNYKQYDIETWMPSRADYGETHSASNVLDFQARRSRIRYRDEEGQLQFVHTLNNTMVASPRILIPLLENHQQEDGSVYIPAALRPYMRGMDLLS